MVVNLIDLTTFGQILNVRKQQAILNILIINSFKIQSVGKIIEIKITINVLHLQNTIFTHIFIFGHSKKFRP
jgi:hypothetical protein